MADSSNHVNVIQSKGGNHVRSRIDRATQRIKAGPGEVRVPHYILGKIIGPVIGKVVVDVGWPVIIKDGSDVKRLIRSES